VDTKPVISLNEADKPIVTKTIHNAVRWRLVEDEFGDVVVCLLVDCLFVECLLVDFLFASLFVSLFVCLLTCELVSLLILFCARFVL
jgi:hypothetical protein